MEDWTFTLINGETLRVGLHSPGVIMPQANVEAVYELIVQPRKPWFSGAERKHLEAALGGMLKDTARDYFFVGTIGDEPVGNVYYGTRSGLLQIGLLAYVITKPGHRGRGICTILTRVALDHFLDAGGRCMQLGTGNRSARHIYERCGFRDYNGHVMRYLGPNEAWRSFDADYFAWAGPAKVRRGGWADLAGVGMLYAAHHHWFIKDYPQRIYSHPAIVHKRCGSILPSMMVNATENNGGLWVLENPAARIVGSATVTLLDGDAQKHVPVLDFLVVPSYMHQADDLLLAVIARHRDARGGRVRLCVASCDDEKAGLARKVGFQHEATLEGQLQAGRDCYDLDIYVCPG
jgi:GNAT superfamily N-acetyltransferase